MFHRLTSAIPVLLWGMIVVGCLAGCQSQNKELLIPVKGRITLDGRPLPRGSLTLRPEAAGGTWHQPTGMIDDNGGFIVYTNGRAGAPPGNFRVVVFVSESTTTEKGSSRPGLPRSLVPARYNDPDKTPLRVEVTTQAGGKTYDLELTSRDS